MRQIKNETNEPTNFSNTFVTLVQYLRESILCAYRNPLSSVIFRIHSASSAMVL